jgi:hypothetical protein
MAGPPTTVTTERRGQTLLVTVDRADVRDAAGASPVAAGEGRHGEGV